MSADEAARAMSEAAPWREIDRCPVVALGEDLNGGIFWFATDRGVVMPMKAHPLASLPGILTLFGGEEDWLARHFPRAGKRGEGPGFNVGDAAAYLIQRSVEAGIFDPETPVLGRGVWRGPNGAIVVNVGSGTLVVNRRRAGVALWSEDDWQSPGLRLEGVLYRAAPAMQRPASVPLGPEAGQELREAFALWPYVEASAAEVIVGFVTQGLLGMGTRWRAHVSIEGPTGSGKTWHTDLVAAALGPMALGVNDATEAGLRQALTSEARVVVLDEAEGDVARGRVQRVVELLRLASSASGARSLRGSIAGAAQRFQVVSAAYLSAIIPPDLKPQDASRITRMALQGLQPSADAASALEAIERIRGLAPGLWARALAGYGRFLENFAVWRAVLTASGCDPRQADQPATLLAGYWTMVADEVIDEGTAKAEIGRYAWMIRTVEENADESGPELCLQHLFGSLVSRRRGGETATIGQLLTEALQFSTMAEHEVLAAHGLKVVQAKGKPPQGLWVANRNPSLSKLFAGTMWADHGWGVDLKRLRDARAEPQPCRIGGAKVRVTFVPLDFLPQVPGDDDDDRS